MKVKVKPRSVASTKCSFLGGGDIWETPKAGLLGGTIMPCYYSHYNIHTRIVNDLNMKKNDKTAWLIGCPVGFFLLVKTT